MRVYDERESGESKDDDDLQQRITDHVESDPDFWVGRGRRMMIVVEVEAGYVTMTGFVKSRVERRKAEIVARALGAVGVDNRLRVEAEVHHRPS